MGLDRYRLLGRTGLRVSPFCLGAMTFGNADGWGVGGDEARRIFDRYIDAGGNFVDTANAYAKGNSEALLGSFLAEPSKRDAVVLATKFSLSTDHADPNAGGNGRKNIYRSLDASLKRLGTDYIDLYWLHAWDTLTPIEEVIETLDDIVRSGKVRYVGLSDVPAWLMARAQTYAELRGRVKIAAVQLEYSLIDRSLEIEHRDACQEMGIGICPWGPLGSGILTGKYRRDSQGADGGRLSDGSHFQARFANERNFQIADDVAAVAQELGCSPSQLALNWVSRQPGVSSTIIGVTKASQLDDNLAALDINIPDDLLRRLDEASRQPAPALYDFFKAPMLGRLQGAAITSQV